MMRSDDKNNTDNVSKLSDGEACSQVNLPNLVETSIVLYLD